MGWRVAGSLLVLENEVKAVYPSMEFGTIGDAAHVGEASDHNPNAAGVVCALDIMCGTNQALADAIVASGHPDLKYVIHNKRIWSPANGWRPYSGSNPHTDHIHVSVGVGSDGKSKPPYDDTNTWGIHTTTTTSTEDDMFCAKGDKNDKVRAMQRLGLKAGGALPQFGVDGDYGDETAAMLASLVGGDGAAYGPDQYAQLMVKLVQANVPAAIPAAPHVHAITINTTSAPANAL